MGEKVRPYSSFQTLRFEIVNGFFSTGNFFYRSRNIEKVISYKKIN